MKKILTALVFICAVETAFSQTKEKDIITLLELTDARNMALQIFDMIIPPIAQLVPAVPQAVWDMMKEKMDIDEFVRSYIPIYDKYYTHEDIKELIAFYKSPIGRKTVAVTPAMTKDSMLMGQDWGARLGQQIIKN